MKWLWVLRRILVGWRRIDLGRWTSRLEPSRSDMVEVHTHPHLKAAEETLVLNHSTCCSPAHCMDEQGNRRDTQFYCSVEDHCSSAQPTTEQGNRCDPQVYTPKPSCRSLEKTFVVLPTTQSRKTTDVAHNCILQSRAVEVWRRSL